jgi:uncharacterized membrane protein
MIEITHVVAIFITLASALALAFQSLFLRMGTEDGDPSLAVFIVIIVNLITLSPLVLIYYYPNYGVTRMSALSFVAAGLSGTIIGRQLKYISISRIGASRTEPITASNALFATALGVILFNETLTKGHLLGICLVVAGVAAIAVETSNGDTDDLPFRKIVIGIIIPLGAALAYALEPIFASYGIDEGTPPPVALLLKTATASVAYIGYLRLTNSLSTLNHIQINNLQWFVLAGIANTLFLCGYYFSLSIAPVSIVVPVIVTSTLLVVLLSAILMPRRLEHVTWRLATLAAVVVSGVLLITISP